MLKISINIFCIMLIKFSYSDEWYLKIEKMQRLDIFVLLVELLNQAKFLLNL